MNPQFLMDGLIAGAMIGLGAIGVTLTYSILRFANFAHGELLSWGAYLAMALADRAYPVFIAALNGYAACSVVAAGVGLANGALVVTGVALVLGCVAACTSAIPSRVSSKK